MYVTYTRIYGWSGMEENPLTNQDIRFREYTMWMTLLVYDYIIPRRILMKLFLCSHFSSVENVIKEEIENKKVAFIPTASLREGYTGYVGSGSKIIEKLGAFVTEIDISTEAYSTIQSV